MSDALMPDPADPEIRITTEEEGIVRIGLILDDAEVSSALVKWFELGFGESVIRVGTIGGVATGEAYRYKGHARRVVKAAVRLVERSDASVVTLFGIPDFYHRFGFTPLGPDFELKIRDTSSLPVLDPAFTVRTARAGDIPELQAIWAKESAGLNGHVIRSDQQDSWLRLGESIATGRDDCRVVVDDNNMVQGYAWLVSHHWAMEGFREEGRNNLDIGEAGATGWKGADAVLALLPAWRDELGRNDIILAIPPHHNSIGRAALFHNVTAQSWFSFNQDYMGLTTGSDQLFRAMLPELNARWQSRQDRWHGTVDVIVGEERTRFHLGERVDLIATEGTADRELAMTPGDCARLVFGAFDPVELLARLGADLPLAHTLGLLFPKSATCIYPADRF